MTSHQRIDDRDVVRILSRIGERKKEMGWVGEKDIRVVTRDRDSRLKSTTTQQSQRFVVAIAH